MQILVNNLERFLQVHNWTVEQTIEWLTTSVELPQYVSTFVEHRVTGATLPRLAVGNFQYLSTVLGIKDPIHKQKIALKAMDVVLFGPPKGSNLGYQITIGKFKSKLSIVDKGLDFFPFNNFCHNFELSFAVFLFKSSCCPILLRTYRFFSHCKSNDI